MNQCATCTALVPKQNLLDSLCVDKSSLRRGTSLSRRRTYIPSFFCLCSFRSSACWHIAKFHHNPQSSSTFSMFFFAPCYHRYAFCRHALPSHHEVHKRHIRCTQCLGRRRVRSALRFPAAILLLFFLLYSLCCPADPHQMRSGEREGRGEGVWGGGGMRKSSEEVSFVWASRDDVFLICPHFSLICR